MLRIALRCLATAVLLSASNSARADYLVYSDSIFGQIRRINTDGTGNTDLAVVVNPSQLAVDPLGGKLYYAGFGFGFPGVGSVGRLNLDGSDPSTVVPGTNGTFAVAVDHVGGKLYFTNSGSADLVRANLDGSGAERIITNEFGLAGIVVDHEAARIYFEGSGGIYSANLDGSGRTLIYSATPVSLVGLALDPETRQLFFTNNLDGTVGRVNTDGTGATTLLTGLDNLNGIAVDPDGGRIYFAEGNTRIGVADLDGGGFRTIATDANLIAGIAFVSTAAVPEPSSLALCGFATAIGLCYARSRLRTA